jgi:archaellum component FlaC
MLNDYVVRNKAHTNLLANAQDIKICQDIARANSGKKIRSEAFKRILANLAKKSSFPWRDSTSLASDARQEIIIGRFTYGNKPFDTSNTEIYQSFDKASAAGAALSAAVLLAKQITTMGQNAINLALDVDDSKRSIYDNFIKAQSLDTRGSTRIYNKNITKFSELVTIFYNKIETTKAEIENIKSNMTSELEILDTLIKGGVTEQAVTQAKTAALDAVDLALSQIEHELVDIQRMIQAIDDLRKEEAAVAVAPRRRKTYGGVCHHRQRKTLKKRRVNKKATRRKGKRHTRRRT